MRIPSFNIMKASLLTIASFGVSSAAMSQSDPAPEISEDDLRPHIETLASDEYEGRLPGTRGGIKAVHYMAMQWFNAGYIGGAKDGSFYQIVPLVRKISLSSIVTFQRDNQSANFSNDQITLIGNVPEAKFSVPVMFVGYGLKKDEVENVKGKAVFLLARGPEHESNDAASTNDRIQKLTEAGAVAVIAIVTKDANWNAIKRFRARPVSLQSSTTDAQVIGYASRNYAEALAKSAGVNWKKYLKDAEDESFNGVDLGLTSSWNVLTQIRKYNSYNVIAKLPGKNPDTGSVFFTGHWDHTGICGPVGAKDRICNGAIDNASGMAVLIEVSKHLGKKSFDRDIYFVGTTAEESGLLGAYHMVDNAPVDIKDIVIALNVDTIAIAPKGAKVAIIGRGETDLDPIIEKIATDLGREIDSSKDANAFIRRQDGWALASKGVPAVMVGGSFSDMKLLGLFLGSDYHTVRDEYNDDTELGGAAEDAVLHLKLAEHFANVATYNGNKASE